MTKMSDKEADALHIAETDGRWITPEALPTPYEDELLTCLIDEMLEVGQRACKIQRFGAKQIQPGHDDNNIQRMSREYGQMCYVWDLLSECGLVDQQEAQRGYHEKGPKLRKYMQAKP